ncbi:hypothetical protein ACER0C_003298 [Sarotherodon galilaeus]
MKNFFRDLGRKNTLDKKIHQRPGPEPRTVSLKSDWSEECLNNFKGKQFSATERKMMKEPVEEPLIKAASSAEEELVRVRTAFVWRALVTDGVLNGLEKDSILDGNPVRADKARCFIDTVRKKGDKASRIMIRHLQIKDQSLFSQLHLYSDPSAQQEALQNCQPRLKSALRKKFQCVFEGIAKAGNPTLLNQIYTELYITEGGTAGVNDEHE